MSDTETEARRTELIIDRIDTERSAGIAASSAIGGIRVENMVQMFEVAKFMAISGPSVPPYLRNNPGSCLAIVIQALEWRMSPFAVANKSYVVSNKGQDRVAFESQLIHAVIESRAPLKGRLKCDYEGEGMDRRCIVTGHLKGEVDPCVFRSEPLGKLLPRRNDQGEFKGSPLWARKPDLQMWYDASRDWARQFCPDVIMGVYGPEEFEENATGADGARDITPPSSLVERLKSGPREAAGFDAEQISKTLGPEDPAQVKGDSPQPDPVAVGAGASLNPPQEAPAPRTNRRAKKAATEAVVDKAEEPRAADEVPPPSEDPQDHSDPAEKGADPVAVETAEKSEPPVSAAAEPEPVTMPTTGKDYPKWVKAVVGSLKTIQQVNDFWTSKAERQLRNALPNMTDEITDDARAIKDARMVEIGTGNV